MPRTGWALRDHMRLMRPETADQIAARQRWYRALELADAEMQRKYPEITIANAREAMAFRDKRARELEKGL